MNAGLTFNMDKVAGLVEVSVEHTPIDIERAVNEKEMTLGIGSDDSEQAKLEVYLSGERSLEPYLRYGDIHDLLAAVQTRLPDGRPARTFLTPRSAAGPNLRYLLTGDRGRMSHIESVSLRLRPKAPMEHRGLYQVNSFNFAAGILRQQIQGKNRPTIMRIYASGESAEADKGALFLFAYDGDREDVHFRHTRLRRTADEMGAEWLDSGPERKDFLDPDRFPPLFLEPPKNLQAEAVIHTSILWSRLAPMLNDLRQKSSGIYSLQTTLSGGWHVAALLSIRLLSRAGERSSSILEKQIKDMLDLLREYEAGVLELRSLQGKQDIMDAQLAGVLGDALTERLHK